MTFNEYSTLNNCVHRKTLSKCTYFFENELSKVRDGRVQSDPNVTFQQITKRLVSFFQA